MKMPALDRTPISERGLAALRLLGPEVSHSGDGARYRYVVGQE
jgi:hypothetical protein